MLLQSINSLTPNGSSSKTWETFALILICLEYLTLHDGLATNFLHSSMLVFVVTVQVAQAHAAGAGTARPQVFVIGERNRGRAVNTCQANR